MTGFWLAAAFAVLVVALLLLRPFLGKRPQQAATSARQLNNAIYRDQLNKLDQDLADGQIAQADFAQARAELQRRALEDTQAETAMAPLRLPRKTLASLLVALPLASFGLYLYLGHPEAMLPAAPHSAQGQPSPQDIERMVEGLAQRLAQHPEDGQGWVMLARSYKVMGRTADAEKAYDKAGSFVDNDAQLLASYADTAATNANGDFSGKPARLIEKALKVDPNNPMALWLAGTAALRAGQKPQAVQIWQRLLPMLAPDSEDAKMLQAAIVEAGGQPSTSAGAAPAAPANSKSAATGAAAEVAGVVELDPALRDKMGADDTVMVIARPVGARMPLAVLRQRASGVPLKFTLDDTLAMNPQALLSQAGEVSIEARISKSGLAMPASGDLISDAQTVKVGAQGITLKIDRVRP